jgi:hypothetical protein
MSDRLIDVKNREIDRLKQEIEILKGRVSEHSPAPPTEKHGRNRAKLIALYLILSAVLVWGSLEFSLELSSFSFSAAAVSLMLAAVTIFDELGVKEFRTHEEIRKGNIAVSLYWLGLCILGGCALIASR